MNNWPTNIEIRNENGGRLIVGLAHFCEGKQFERWAKSEIQIHSETIQFITGIDFEYSDIKSLIEVLIRLKSSSQNKWTNIETNFSMDFKVSNLGAVKINIIVKKQTSAVQHLEYTLLTNLSVLGDFANKLIHHLSAKVD